MTGNDWLSRFCQDLPVLRQLTAAAAPVRERLEHLAADAAAGRADATWAERFVQLQRDLGIAATGADRAWQPQVGGVGHLLYTGTSTPSVDLYRCPGSVCTRRELRAPSGAEPRCTLLGEPLALADQP